MIQRKLYTISEVAEMLGVHRNAIGILIRTGKLKACRLIVNGSHRDDRDDGEVSETNHEQ